MKKIMAVVLSTLVCFACFAGCKDSNENETTISDTVEVTNEKTKESQETTTLNSENEDMLAINNELDEIMTIYPGSAGCSLRSAIVATRCMKFADKTQLTQEEIAKAIDDYYANLNDEEKGTFLESVNLVIAMLKDFMKNWKNSKAVLEDAGIAKDFEDYVPNKDKILPLYNAFKDFVLENQL